MNLLKSDLRELNLSMSDLLDKFWKVQSEEGGTTRLSSEIKEEYLKLLNSCRPEQMTQIRHLVTKVVVFAGVRGMQWADELRRRDDREKEDGNEWCLLRHPSIQEMLRRTPRVSTREICKALDSRGESLPWKTLPRETQNGLAADNPFWEPNRNHQYVKSLITRARKKLAQMDEDREYVSLLNKNRRQFSEDVKAAKKKASDRNAPKSGFLPGMDGQ